MNNGHSLAQYPIDHVSSLRSSTPKVGAVFSHIIDSEEKIEQVNGSGEFPVSLFAMRQNPVHVALTGIQGSSLSIWTTDSRHGFTSRPTKPADLLTIRFVNNGVLFRDDPRGGGLIVDSTHALLTSFEEMRYQQVSPSFSSTTATISRDVIQTAWQAFTASNSLGLPEFNTTADTRTPAVLAIRQTLGLYQRHLRNDRHLADLMTPLLEELLAYQIISAWPKLREQGDRVVLNAPDVAIRRAVEYIEVNIQNKVSIGQIAAAADLSVRTLQIAFKKRLDCSPIQYLIARRLDGAQLDLLKRKDLSVSQVAQSWGFVHMSDFSRRFRERFGQSPLRFRNIN